MRPLTKATLSLLTLCSIFSSCEKNVLNKRPVVNAGADITLNSPESHLTLTATASDPDDTIVAYSWAKIAGPGAVTIGNPGALSTDVWGLQEGEYQFRFAAVDGHGGASADTVMVVVKSPTYEYHWLNYQPHNNVNEVHLFGSATVDQTHPGAPELLAGSGTFEGTAVNIRALLQFDLSNIPANAVIDSAVLTLYTNYTPLNGQNGVANSGLDNSLFISRVTETWDPTTITWLNQPGVTNDGRISVPHTNAPFEDLSVNVKDLVNVLRTESNNGFLIHLQNETMYTFRIFCSSKYSDSSRHPRLDIKYHVE
jgi:hypothetical protein